MAHRFVAKSRFGATSSSARSSGDQREAVSCGLHVSGRDSGKASGSVWFEATQSASHSSGNPRVLAPAMGSVALSAKLGRGATASQPHDDAPWFPSKRPRLSLVETAPQPTPLDSRISLQVSKAITGFARYPHKRPRGLHSDYDGSLDIDEIWKHWGRHHGVSKHHMLQFISEHAFSSEGRRRFLLRSDHDGRTWVSVTRSVRRFSKRRRQCGYPGASRTLATARDGDDDMLSISSGCSLEAVQATGSTEVKSEPSSPAPGSHQEPAVPPTLLCKEEVPASIPLTCPLPDSSDPVPGFTDPVAGPGLLDGFSFFFTETDNFGCPVVTGDGLSPLSDTISHTVPDTFSGTLEGITVDSLLFAETDPSQPSDREVPCPGQPVFAQHDSGVSHSLADSRSTPVPPLEPCLRAAPRWQPHPHSSCPSLGSQGHLGSGYAPPTVPLFWDSHLPRCSHRRYKTFQFGPLRPYHTPCPVLPRLRW